MKQTSKFMLLGLFSILVLWGLGFYQGITTAVNVWYSSEIYNHCFLVIPVVCYLLYQNKDQLIEQPIRPNYWLMIPITGLLAIQLFAQIGDIKLLMHMASFIALPLMIWILLGNKATRVIAFPLFFMVFAIPVGDQLIPYLQELTTDLAVPLLELTQVPIYRNGLYLEIPEGQFLVAEACSGVSFLITSIAFGFIYSYVSFSSLKKRCYFILLAVIVPIIANALRVYGIILTGHLTDMQHAVGADHLIYGGIFYCIILFILILIGERYRDTALTTTSSKKSDLPANSHHQQKQIAIVFVGLITVIGLQQFWLYYIDTSPIKKQYWPVDKMLTRLNFEAQNRPHLLPQLNNSTQVVTGQLSSKQPIGSDNKPKLVDFYGAYFDEVSGELIASEHRMYDDKYWTLLNSNKVQIAGEHYNKLTLTTQQGQHRIVYYWYLINGKAFVSQTKAKLYQTYLKVSNENASGHLLMLSSSSIDKVVLNTEIELILKQPHKLVNNYYQQLNQLPTKK